MDSEQYFIPQQDLFHDNRAAGPLPQQQDLFHSSRTSSIAADLFHDNKDLFHDNKAADLFHDNRAAGPLPQQQDLFHSSRTSSTAADLFQNNKGLLKEGGEEIVTTYPANLGPSIVSQSETSSSAGFIFINYFDFVHNDADLHYSTRIFPSHSSAIPARALGLERASTTPMANNASTSQLQSQQLVPLPRVAIQFCTQCKWMLRAAYFAQELLSTFSTSIGEVALIPATGGVFTVTITTAPPVPETSPSASDPSSTLPSSPPPPTTTAILWDRKTEGGFPETKELKRRVRDVIQPGRDLGHVDRHHAAAPKPPSQPQPQQPTPPQHTTTGMSPSSTGENKGGSENPPPSSAGGPPAASSRLSEDAKASIAAARANKGQSDVSHVDGSALKAELGLGDRGTRDTCEDCT
ncbi:hypothetical protein ACRALDRAFT_1071974 [Sodiomyces alcalophilus JCM 7366]|uniref:uncharacterized protein n=1 Tax=Sodiomyces alcalophilus JCM 7366 TaxID=591952 RepID=UPI0039B5F588